MTKSKVPLLDLSSAMAQVPNRVVSHENLSDVFSRLTSNNNKKTNNLKNSARGKERVQNLENEGSEYNDVDDDTILIKRSNSFPD